MLFEAWNDHLYEKANVRDQEDGCDLALSWFKEIISVVKYEKDFGFGKLDGYFIKVKSNKKGQDTNIVEEESVGYVRTNDDIYFINETSGKVHILGNKSLLLVLLKFEGVCYVNHEIIRRPTAMNAPPMHPRQYLDFCLGQWLNRNISLELLTVTSIESILADFFAKPFEKQDLEQSPSSLKPTDMIGTNHQNLSQESIETLLQLSPEEIFSDSTTASRYNRLFTQGKNTSNHHSSLFSKSVFSTEYYSENKGLGILKGIHIAKRYILTEHGTTFYTDSSDIGNYFIILPKGFLCRFEIFHQHATANPVSSQSQELLGHKQLPPPPVSSTPIFSFGATTTTATAPMVHPQSSVATNVTTSPFGVRAVAQTSSTTSTTTIQPPTFSFGAAQTSTTTSQQAPIFSFGAAQTSSSVTQPPAATSSTVIPSFSFSTPPLFSVRKVYLAYIFEENYSEFFMKFLPVIVHPNYHFSIISYPYALSLRPLEKK